jgi:uncharacterized protein YvpB
MRRRHQILLTLLFAANLAVALTFAGLALAHHSLPPLDVGRGLPPDPYPTRLDLSQRPTPPEAAATEAAQAQARPTLPSAAAVAPVASAQVAPPAAASPLPTQSAELSFLPASALPDSATVAGVPGHRQALPLSCEARSAADWAAFFGVAIDELEFVSRLPVSDDPDRGFVGDVRGAWGQIPPSPYGVHAGPVARLLQTYGLRAEARRYIDWEVVKAELAAGRPVIAWVTGHVEAGTAEIYSAADGRKTVVARFEHTVILTGYAAESVTVVDGARRYERPLAAFLESWAVLRNMAITYDN